MVGAMDDDSSGHSESQSSKNLGDSDSASGTSGSNSHSSTSPSTSTGRSAGARGLPEEIIATKETKAVWYSKLLVLTVLLIAAGVAGFMTFWLTDSSEQDDFETQVCINNIVFRIFHIILSMFKHLMIL